MDTSRIFSRRTEDNTSAIALVSAALQYELDEWVLATGGTFAEFQAAAIGLASAQPLGDDSAPDSRPTVVATIRLAAA